MRIANISSLLSGLLLLVLISCISIKPPVDKRKAKKRLDRHVQGIELITTLHPELSEQFKVTIRDTVFIPDKRDSIIFTTSQDTVLVDSLLFEYGEMVKEKVEIERLLKEGEVIGEGNQKVAKRRIRDLQGMLLRLKGEVMIIKDTSFFYIDSLSIQTKRGNQVILDSIEINLENGKVIVNRVREGALVVNETEVETDVFTINVFDFPLKIGKGKLILIGIIVLVIVGGRIVVKVFKPF